MFPYLHCVVRIRETNVPPLDDPFIISPIFGPLGVSCLLCVPVMGVIAIL